MRAPSISNESAPSDHSDPRGRALGPLPPLSLPAPPAPAAVGFADSEPVAKSPAAVEGASYGRLSRALLQAPSAPQPEPSQPADGTAYTAEDLKDARERLYLHVYGVYLPSFVSLRSALRPDATRPKPRPPCSTSPTLAGITAPDSCPRAPALAAGAKAPGSQVITVFRPETSGVLVIRACRSSNATDRDLSLWLLESEPEAPHAQAPAGAGGRARGCATMECGVASCSAAVAVAAGHRYFVLARTWDGGMEDLTKHFSFGFALTEQAAAAAVVASAAAAPPPPPPRTPLAYAPVAGPNPLKGFAAFWEPGSSSRGYMPGADLSLEFVYERIMPLSLVIVGPRTYDWDALDSKLNDVAARGHQSLVRLYMDYPGRPSAIPAHLTAAGLKTTAYGAYGGGASPDYTSPLLEVRPLIIKI
eukprot:tig00000545_g1979.t1